MGGLFSGGLIFFRGGGGQGAHYRNLTVNNTKLLVRTARRWPRPFNRGFLYSKITDYLFLDPDNWPLKRGWHLMVKYLLTVLVDYKQTHTPTVVQGGGGGAIDGAPPSWGFVILQDFEKFSPLV